MLRALSFLSALSLAVFFSAKDAKAREGLHYLNSFPATNAFFSSSLLYQDIEIEAQDLVESYEDHDKSAVVKLKYGAKLTRWSWASVELPYIYREENSLRYGSPSRENYVFRGFREPKFVYAKRFRHKVSDGNYYSDLQVGFIPGLFDKRSGEAHTSGWSGSTVFSAQISTGAVYEKYEARIRGDFSFHSAGEGENVETDEVYTTDPFYDLETALELQYAHRDHWLFFLESAIFFTQDYKVKIEDKSTTVQQGTASSAKLGLKRLLENSFITLSYSYRNNDFFTTNKSVGNFRGDFSQEGYFLAWTRNL